MIHKAIFCANTSHISQLEDLKFGSFDPAFFRGRRLLMKCDFQPFFQVDLLPPILENLGAVWRDPRDSNDSEHYNTRKKGRQLYNTNTDTLLYFISLYSNYPSYVTPVFFLWTFIKIPKQHTVLGMS